MDKHIEVLLLHNDCVIVPGFGGFMAHHIDACKDARDGAFIPPRRSIGFNPKLTLNDSLLAQSYVEAYDISYPDAVKRIEGEVNELKQRIESDGLYSFPGIGTIKLNSEGHYEFAPCEAGILSPKLYGLGIFKMKTVNEIMGVNGENADSVKEKKYFGKPILSRIINKRRTFVTSMWRNVAAACVAIIVFLLIPAPLTNSSQQASSIDTRFLDMVASTSNSQKSVSPTVKIPVQPTAKKPVAKKEVKAQAQPKVVENKEAKSGYTVVISSRITLKNAKAYTEQLHKQGYTEASVYTNGKRNKVVYGIYPTREEASKVLNKLNDKKEFEGAWITFIK